MTTEIVVKANHGWPVRVTAIDPKTSTATGHGGIVQAGQTQTFHCHSGAELIVHEIQPDEDDFAAHGPQSTDKALKRE